MEIRVSIKQSLNIRFIKTNQNATLPTVKHNGDIGFDVSSAEDIILQPHSTVGVDTGLQLADCPLQDPDGHSYYIKVEGRSGMALKGIFPVGGIIDVSYRGVCKVILHNSTNKEYSIKVGDRIAQFVIYKAASNVGSYEIDMSETNQVVSTERNASGFGSTGK